MEPPVREERGVNEAIRAQAVRVVDTNGTVLGVFPTADAIELAAERGLDLVEVSPNSDPPVCKILDYGKLKYEPVSYTHLTLPTKRIV